MRILDLFCGAGGAAMGYHRAGFEVIGVDIAPQPHYPFEFHQANALTFPLDGFDAIHASPPCQRYSQATRFQPAMLRDSYPELIEPTRTRLIASGVPYVIENVPHAPLLNPVMLCGGQFGLTMTFRGELVGLRRHRGIESNCDITDPGRHDHRFRAVSVFGGGDKYFRKGFNQLCRDVMGIDWMTHQELAEAVPPVYTEHVGHQLAKEL